ncbi:hypothetical protein GIB67_002146 [Kingdonia uniflora]|uniref:Uncharacterized protein n=1 Tax=Kingdonia uniflora TaxID=39325 RepID=A0A7J7KWI6_9MAGN|nr:hypothetical protein GIB67_002146 [Kingdonia uniflora]
MFSNLFIPVGDYSSSSWTRDQDKLFEHALLVVPEKSPNRWQIIASHVPGKSWVEVRDHFERLVYDVGEIDAGRVDLPSYGDDSGSDGDDDDESFETVSWDRASQISFGVGVKRRGETTTERKKGLPWTEDEHRLFLQGLDKYGKGDWRSISRKMVVSRTPTQVASHAQKYYLRLKSLAKKEKKRSSIHDITTVEDNLMKKNLDAPSSVSIQQHQVVQSISSLLPTSSFQVRGGVSSGYQQGYGYPV